MKIALYLGSFNPFHNGHLEVIKTALNDFKMDRIIIVPTMQNPWKKEKVLDINKREEIIRKSIFNSNLVSKYIPALQDFSIKIDEKWIPLKPKGILISLIEKFLIPPYYSYATLHALKNKYCNDEIFVLCGEDTIKDIPNWMNGEQIIKDYDFLVVDRPKNSISSSYIREILKTSNKLDSYADTKLRYLVSPNIINLIQEYYK